MSDIGPYNKSDGDAFGFIWRLEGATSVQVERTATLPGSRRVITLVTDKQRVELYITRTGLVRVFSSTRKNQHKKKELKR